ncbi:uncharacterized protein LOC124806189 [Hydra vulgaris]|uniref:uncharacterized protein LOC124806189 n=1 Tax=Hydra vulgaris TaxID=6087 RepID=UPI0032E9BF85
MSNLPEHIWDELAMDFFGPLPSGEYLFVIEDLYSRYPFVDIMKITTALNVISKLERLFAIYGYPNKIRSDNGPPFQSEELKLYFKNVDIKHIKLTPRYPQAKGIIEKIYAKLIQMLAKFDPVMQKPLALAIKGGTSDHYCGGQRYDYESNMKEKINGVQKRILNLNYIALYVPCGSRSLNLVISESERSLVKSITLFGILQRLFTLFSASVSRWKILIDHVKILHLKKLCDARWEAKISNVKAVRYQVGNIHDALIALPEIEGCDPVTAHEAITLAEQLKNFNFLLSLIVLYDVLFQVNIVSKTLQEKDMDITQCAKLLRSYCSFLKIYRKCGFKDAIIKVKDLALELQVEPVFKPLK